MTDWTSGYVADIGYTYGYYPELNPLRVKLAFLNAGLVAPEIGTACELGFGQGISTNIHATASIIRWSGTDFNPSQAGFAQELASLSQSGAELFDESFDQYSNRLDLPEFDYIGLHGIWSWISDENRATIVDFIKRKLKVGGVLYISFNTEAGWASMLPVRDLLAEHAQVMGSEGIGIVSRIDGALNFVDRLLEVNPAYARVNPQVRERFNNIKEQNRNYIAHEYFNKDWEPMAFPKVAKWLQPAKVEWACSANYIDTVDSINLSKEQQTLLSGITDTIFHQTVRDFCVSQSFRRDYWVKGPRKLTAYDRDHEIRQLKIVLIQPRNSVSLKIDASLGSATLRDAVYQPILDIMKNNDTYTIGELEHLLDKSVGKGGINFKQLIQAILVLTGKGVVASAQNSELIEKVKTKTEKLNNYLMLRARSNPDINYLASPVTGGGIYLSRFDMLFTLAHCQGLEKSEEYAVFVWNIVSSQGQRIIKDGKAIEDVQESILRLKSHAMNYCETLLPVLKALQIA